MTEGEEFLAYLRERTTAHLLELARESGRCFGKYTHLPELGPRIYRRLVEEFQLDGAQEIGARIIDLFAGRMDNGALAVTEREYRGLKLVRDEFSPELDPSTAQTLHELVHALGHGSSR